MKICVLTTSHTVRDARVFHKETQSLKREFGNICMLCQHDRAVDEIDGVRIVGVSPRSGRSILGRFRIMRELYALGREQAADVYHTHEPDAAFVGYLLKKKMGARVIYDSHEVYPDMFAMNFSPFRSVNKLVRNLVYKAEKFIAKRMDLIIGTNQYALDYFAQMVPDIPAILIDNVPSLELMPDVVKPVNDPPLLVYEGNLSYKRAMKELLEALHILKTQRVPFKFRYMGRIHPAEQAYFDDYVKTHELEDVVTDMGFLPYEELGKNLAAGDIGILTLHPVINYLYSTPNKLYNYMRYEMPMVAPDFLEIARVINKTGAGLLIDSCDPKDIAEKLRTLLLDEKLRKEMGAKGKEAVLAEYNWTQAEKVLFAAYRILE